MIYFRCSYILLQSVIKSCLGAVEEGKKKVGSITGKREFEAFLETSMGTREGKET